MGNSRTQRRDKEEKSLLKKVSRGKFQSIRGEGNGSGGYNQGERKRETELKKKFKREVENVQGRGTADESL